MCAAKRQVYELEEREHWDSCNTLFQQIQFQCVICKVFPTSPISRDFHYGDVNHKIKERYFIERWNRTYNLPEDLGGMIMKYLLCNTKLQRFEECFFTCLVK